jgi:plasmid maintenance system antidote protein VapI
MNAAGYLDALRERLQLPSDYAISRRMGIGAQTISNYRRGRSGFDDDMAIRVAELLGLRPEVVIGEMHAERAQSEATRRFWLELADAYRTSPKPQE